jgi:hypothetical protein
MQDERFAADHKGQEGLQAQTPALLEGSRPGPGSLVLYVHERSDGTRELTGGGITADGTCADIFATLRPDGVWSGVAYEDLLPGRYDIVGSSFVRVDGYIVPSGK